MNPKYIIITTAIILMMCGTASAWLSGYDHRMAITVENLEASPLTDYQFNFTNDTNILVAAGHMQSDGADCRITDSLDNLIPFWTETAFNAAGTKIWANATLEVGSNMFYMYYGNSVASDVSSGPYTFGPFSEIIDEWTPYTNNPFSVDTVFASRLKVGSTYHAYYSGVYGTKYQINHATSTDGKIWTDDTANNPVLAKGSDGSWEDKELICSWVWIEDSVWYMIYHGRNVANTIQAVGLATSVDGISWDKSASNPVFIGTETWDMNDAENWGVIKVESTYYMWYESAVAGYRQLGLATSTDLINWVADSNNPIFTSTAGNEKCCPDCFKVGDYYYLLFRHQGPPESIVLYRDSNPTFYPADREFLGYAHWCPSSGWDSNALDTPFVLTDDIYRNSYAASNNELWMYYDGRSVPGFFDAGMTIEPDIDAALTPTTGIAYGFDDFENGVGTWIEDGGYTDGSIAEENSIVKIHSHSAKHTTPTTHSIFYRPLDTIQTNDQIIEFYVRPAQTDVNMWCTIAQGTTHDSFKMAAHIVFFEDGYIKYMSSTWHNIIAYSADTWYRIKLSDIDFTTDTFDIWIDGVKEKDDVPFYNSVDLSYCDHFKTHVGGAGTNYIDMLFVRKYAATEPTSQLGAEEDAPAGNNDIVLDANQHGMLRKDVDAAQTFSTIAAGIDHDRCYTWWDSTNDRWESYRVGYSYNADESVPAHDSYFVLMDGAGTTISCSIAAAETVAIPTGWYATYLRESASKTLSTIKTDMGGNVVDLYAFDPTTGAWTDTGTYSVLPNQGLLLNSNAGFNWDGTVT